MLAPSGGFNGVCRCWFVLVFQVDFSISVITTRFQAYLMAADAPRHRRGNWFGVAHLTLSAFSTGRSFQLSTMAEKALVRSAWIEAVAAELMVAQFAAQAVTGPLITPRRAPTGAAIAERHPGAGGLWQELRR